MIHSYDIAIIGAGISSILLARNIHDKRIIILEKSKGVGGRIATRRLQKVIINHGPKSIALNHPLLLEAAAGALDNNILEMKDGLCFPVQSMNEWAKFLVKDLTVVKETLVHRIIKNQSGLYEVRDNADVIVAFAKKIILTAPAPQTYAILKQSGFEADFLLEATYSSAIQFLAILDSLISKESEIWDLLDLKQHTSLSGPELYHLEYKDKFNRNLLDMDTKLIQKQLIEMCQQDGKQVIESHVHKWRYSEVTHPVQEKHQLNFSEDNIFLAGDYFFGNNLNSSAKSAEYLLSQKDF